MEQKKEMMVRITHAGANRITSRHVERALRNAMHKYSTAAIEVVELDEVEEAEISANDGEETIDAYLAFPSHKESERQMIERLRAFDQGGPQHGSTTGTSRRRHGCITGSC